MGGHQSARSTSVVWLTPQDVTAPLGAFRLDPCAAPPPRPWETAQTMISHPEDGLAADWDGRVWLNPPYGSPKVIGPWMRRMARHNWGTAMIFARTETALFFETVWDAASALLFIEGRLHFHWAFPGIGPACTGEHAFIPIPGSKNARACAACGVAEQNSGAPSVLVAYGADDAEVLSSCGLTGAFVPLRLPRSYIVAALEETWREVVLAWVRAQRGPVAVADLYRAFAHHPKARRNPNWRAKLRQTLQRGPFRQTGRATWEAVA